MISTRVRKELFKNAQPQLHKTKMIRTQREISINIFLHLSETDCDLWDKAEPMTRIEPGLSILCTHRHQTLLTEKRESRGPISNGRGWC